MVRLFEILIACVASVNAVVIQNAQSKRCMEVAFNQPLEKQVIVLSDCNGELWQEFNYMDGMIQSKVGDNMCLRLPAPRSWMPLLLAPCDEDDINQRLYYASKKYIVSGAYPVFAIGGSSFYPPVRTHAGRTWTATYNWIFHW